jgi:hypothetical protein
LALNEAKPNYVLCLFNEIQAPISSSNNSTKKSAFFLLLLGLIDSQHGNNSLLSAHAYQHYVSATTSLKLLSWCEIIAPSSTQTFD